MFSMPKTCETILPKIVFFFSPKKKKPRRRCIHSYIYNHNKENEKENISKLYGGTMCLNYVQFSFYFYYRKMEIELLCKTLNRIA